MNNTQNLEYDTVYDIKVESAERPTADGGTWGNRPESLKQGGSWIALPVRTFPEPGRTTPREALSGYNETHWVNLDGTTSACNLTKYNGFTALFPPETS